MPQNKQMKIQWITVNGRQVPLVLPQTYNYDKDDWVITSDKDPLPIVEYGTTEGGVIVPKRVSDEGHELTQLTGSNVEVKTLVEARVLTESTFYFNLADLTNYREFDLRITNTHDVDILLGFRKEDNSSIHLISSDGEKATYNPYTGSGYRFHRIPKESNFIYLSQLPLENTTKPLPYKDYRDRINLFYRPVSKPTTGSITIEAVGVLW